MNFFSDYLSHALPSGYSDCFIKILFKIILVPILNIPLLNFEAFTCIKKAAANKWLNETTKRHYKRHVRLYSLVVYSRSCDRGVVCL